MTIFDLAMKIIDSFEYMKASTNELCLNKEAMRNNIASLLKTNIENVSIKAMTYNSLGDIGNNNAAEAYCVVMLRSK